MRMRLMRGIAVSFLSLGIAALFAQYVPPTIRVPVRVVTVPTLVSSKEGQLIPGLEAADFRVFDNGRLQKVALDASSTPLSVALVVQGNSDVRDYLSFIAKAGSVIESLLLGESGEAAVIVYRDEVTVVKPFDAGDMQSALRNLSASGRDAHMIDAGLRGLALLKERPAARARILAIIGQPMDSGSESRLQSLKEAAERDRVTVFALTLPEFGKVFVSDTFSLEALSSRTDRGGFKAGVDLGKLVSAVDRSGKAEAGADPFSILTAATGGSQIRIRKQKEFEDAIAAIRVQWRSSYLLSYSPGSDYPGYHTIKVDVTVRGARTYSRPGYWMGEN